MADVTRQLRRVNQKLEDFFCHADSAAGDALLAVGPDRFVDLLSELTRAGELIAADTANTVAIDELIRYRENLERLQGLLPLLQVQLHLQRAGLDSERTHLEAASGWAIRSKLHFGYCDISR